MNTLENLSTEELKKLLEEREAKEKKEAQEKRKAYEEIKDNLVKYLVEQSSDLNEAMKGFKIMVLEELETFYKMMHEYGDVAKNNKGNFSIRSADGTCKVDYSRQINYSFDERATLADQKLKNFLSSFVKKENSEAYDLINSLLEKDKAGNYDPKLIQKLYKYEDKFDHQDWKDAIRLFKESYQESNTATYVRFFKVDENGKQQIINLNFSSI